MNATTTAALVLLIGLGHRSLVAQDVRVAFTGGAAISAMAGTDTLRQPGDAHLGFAGGVSLDVGLRGGLGLRLEGQYVQKGFGTNRGGVFTAYWEAPVLLRYRFDADYTGVAPMLALGVAPAWQTSCRSYAHLIESLPDPPYIHDYIQAADCNGLRMDGPDLGLVGAAGIVTTTGRVRWSIEARYTGGLANLARVYGGSPWRNRNVTVLAGLGIVLHEHRARK